MATSYEVSWLMTMGSDASELIATLAIASNLYIFFQGGSANVQGCTALYVEQLSFNVF